MSKITITVELDENEAIALAHFVKRVTFATCVGHAVPGNKEEAQQMIDGLEAVGRGLAQAGYAPR